MAESKGQTVRAIVACDDKIIDSAVATLKNAGYLASHETLRSTNRNLEFIRSILGHAIAALGEERCKDLNNLTISKSEFVEAMLRSEWWGTVINKLSAEMLFDICADQSVDICRRKMNATQFFIAFAWIGSPEIKKANSNWSPDSRDAITTVHWLTQPQFDKNGNMCPDQSQITKDGTFRGCMSRDAAVSYLKSKPQNDDKIENTMLLRLGEPRCDLADNGSVSYIVCQFVLTLRSPTGDIEHTAAFQMNHESGTLEVKI